VHNKVILGEDEDGLFHCLPLLCQVLHMPFPKRNRKNFLPIFGNRWVFTGVISTVRATAECLSMDLPYPSKGDFWICPSVAAIDSL